MCSYANITFKFLGCSNCYLQTQIPEKVEEDENLFIKADGTLVGWGKLGDTSDTGIAQQGRGGVFSVVRYTDFKANFTLLCFSIKITSQT